MSDKEKTDELVVVDIHRYKKIKNALNDSEARYRSLFENMPIGIFRFSADGKILDANPALQKMLGYAASAEVERKNPGEKDKNLLIILSEFCAKIESQNEFRSFDLSWRNKDNTPLFIRVNARIVSASANKVLFCEGTVEDISERKQAESQREAALEALRESEEKYRSIFNNIVDLYYQTDMQGLITNLSPSCFVLSGYQPEELIGCQVLDFYTDPKKRKTFLKKLLREGAVSDFEIALLHRDGRHIAASVSSHLIRNEQGDFKSVEGIIRDISERKRVEFQREAALKALHESQALITTIVDSTSDMIWSVDSENFALLSFNQGLSNHFFKQRGIGIQVGMRPEDLFPNDKFINKWHGLYRRAISEGTYTTEYIGIVGPVVLQITFNLLKRDNKVFGISVFGKDITERKQAESQREAALKALQDSLAGKEVLLKEVYHRVKNNLAAILGLLQLQREMVTDPAALTQFSELEGRIRSMALVHETFYSSESLDRIDLQDYIEKLIVELRAALAPGRDIRISVAATGVEMGLDCAIPCGLILNELLTNVFKYAFPGDQPRAGEKACEITIAVEWDGNAGDDGVYTLTVSDNGVGLPVDLDWAKTQTLGLPLVRMLGEYQLNGRVELDRSQGTSFRLVFASLQREKR